MKITKNNLTKIVQGVGTGLGFGLGVAFTVLPSQTIHAQSTLLRDAKTSSSHLDKSVSDGLTRHDVAYKDHYDQTPKEDSLVSNYLRTTSIDELLKNMRFTNISAINLDWKSKEDPGDRVQEKYVAYLVYLDTAKTDGGLIFEKDLKIKNYSKALSSLQMLKQHFNIYTVDNTTKTVGTSGEKIEVSQNGVRKVIKDNYCIISWLREIVEKAETKAGTEYLIRLVGTPKNTRLLKKSDPTDESRIVADFLGKQKEIHNSGNSNDRDIVSLELYGTSDFNKQFGGGAALRLRLGNKSPVAIALGYNYLQDNLPTVFSVEKDVLEPNVQGYVTSHFDDLVTKNTNINYNGSVGLIVDISKSVAIATRLDLASFTENVSKQTVQRNYWTGTDKLVDPTEDINENPVGHAVNSMSSVPFKPAKVNLGVELKVANHWAVKAMGGLKLYESNSPATLDLGGVYHF